MYVRIFDDTSLILYVRMYIYIWYMHTYALTYISAETKDKYIRIYNV